MLGGGATLNALKSIISASFFTMFADFSIVLVFSSEAKASFYTMYDNIREIFNITARG